MPGPHDTEKRKSKRNSGGVDSKGEAKERTLRVLELKIQNGSDGRECNRTEKNAVKEEARNCSLRRRLPCPSRVLVGGGRVHERMRGKEAS